MVARPCGCVPVRVCMCCWKNVPGFHRTSHFWQWCYLFVPHIRDFFVELYKLQKCEYNSH
jgi:hypothetical protein